MERGRREAKLRHQAGRGRRSAHCNSRLWWRLLNGVQRRSPSARPEKARQGVRNDSGQAFWRGFGRKAAASSFRCDDTPGRVFYPDDNGRAEAGIVGLCPAGIGQQAGSRRLSDLEASTISLSIHPMPTLLRCTSPRRKRKVPEVWTPLSPGLVSSAKCVPSPGARDQSRGLGRTQPCPPGGEGADSLGKTCQRARRKPGNGHPRGLEYTQAEQVPPSQ